MFQLLQSSAHTEPRTFQFLVLPCQQGGWGYTRSWEGTQPGQLTQVGQRDIPYHMASCSAMTAGAKKEEGGVVWCHIWSDSLIAFAVIVRFSCSDSLRILGWGFSNLLYLSICCSECTLFVCRHFYFQLLVYITHPDSVFTFSEFAPTQ